MKRNAHFGLIALCAVTAACISVSARAAELAGVEPGLADNVRRELSALPYYGVFDLLTYQVNDKGLVTLGGYVYNGSLRDAAQRAVKKIPGVQEVENKIEALPVSISDDEVRWATYQAIYRDSPLSRYGTAEDALSAFRPRVWIWGRGFRSWSAFSDPRWAAAPFYGMEPVGAYAIHIIVKKGQVTLAGVVDNDSDAKLAAIKAGGVMGSLKVLNDLHVESAAERK